jgi:hypothetical protein
VVVDGVTEILPEPFSTGTGIFPGVNVPLVASAAVQFKVAVHPLEISPVELKLPVGALPKETVTLAAAWEAEPQGAVTVSV